jgi:fibronectin-binding autotransporter adhesin
LRIAHLPGSTGTLTYDVRGSGFTASSIEFGAGNGLLDLISTGGTDLLTPISGPGRVVKRGGPLSGVASLRGQNTYTGSTSVLGGTLRIREDANLGTPPQSFVSDHLFLNGGTLSVFASFAFALTRGISIGANGGAISVTSGTVSYHHELNVENGAIFTKSGNGRLLVGGIELGGPGSGGVVVSAGELATPLLDVAPSSAATITVTGTGVLNMSIFGPQPLNLASDMLGGSTLNFGTGGTSGNVNASAITGTNAVVNFNHTGSLNLTVPITGDLQVNKTGSGTTTLSGNNSYTGATTVNAGTLVMAGAGEITSTITVNNSATMTINGSTTGPISVNNSAVLSGTGTAEDVTIHSGATLSPGINAPYSTMNPFRDLTCRLPESPETASMTWSK